MQATSSQVTPATSPSFSTAMMTDFVSAEPNSAIILPMQKAIVPFEERAHTLEGRRRRSNRRRAR